MKDKQIDSWTVAGHGALARAWHGDKEDKLAGITLDRTKDGRYFWYRVIGCSRMGDVWLTANFTRENGYDHRVDVAELSAWSNEP